MSDPAVRIGVIGGSGLYKMPQLTDVEEHDIDTPYGKPSDTIIIGTLNGVRVAFLPRHGRGHVYTPSDVPYRANIYAMKLMGVERLIAVSACGSLRTDYAPGDIVIPDQLFDNTKDERGRTFFEKGMVGHVGVADPFCPDLSTWLADAVENAGGTIHRGGAYVTIEGPRFSTRAESNVFRQWGMSLIGMTTSPEAYLAREAELCYGVMAHVTDYDVWHEAEEPVTVEMVIQTLSKNLSIAQNALISLVAEIAGRDRPCDCPHALASALITDQRKIPADTLERLEPLVGKYLDS